jgi:hypothetical protein
MNRNEEKQTMKNEEHMRISSKSQERQTKTRKGINKSNK